MSQSLPAGYAAAGVPHEAGSTALALALVVRLAGMFSRGQNQMNIPALSNCVAKSPPPAAAKPGPYDAGRVSLTVQPAVPARSEQSVAVVVPSCGALVAFLHELVFVV
jgi:hypothetical protein